MSARRSGTRSGTLNRAGGPRTWTGKSAGQPDRELPAHPVREAGPQSGPATSTRIER